MRETLAQTVLGISNWSGWGPRKSWRRRLTPFGLSAVAGASLAVGRIDPASGWQDIAVSIVAVGLVVTPGCLIHFGPLGDDSIQEDAA